MLLKFFTNSDARSYLRGLAEEFDESTNSIRLELNNLSEAGYLVSSENGRTIEYRANTRHQLYPEIKRIVHKYLGLDNIVQNVIKKLGKVQFALVTGDYAKGKDSGIIDLVLVGEIDWKSLENLRRKAEKVIKRKIRTLILTMPEFRKLSGTLQAEKALLLWKADEI